MSQFFDGWINTGITLLWGSVLFVLGMMWLITTISQAREAGHRAAQTIDPSDSGPINFGALSLFFLLCMVFATMEYQRGNMDWFDGWLAAGILAAVVAYLVYPPPGFYWQRKKTPRTSDKGDLT